MALSVECLEAETIRVCLTEGEVTSCCFVSSHHLVAEKEKQLRAANSKQIAELQV
jgi:hypothetical protein